MTDKLKCPRCGETEKIESGIVTFPVSYNFLHCQKCGYTIVSNWKIIDKNLTNKLIDYIEEKC